MISSIVCGEHIQPEFELFIGSHIMKKGLEGDTP